MTDLKELDTELLLRPWCGYGCGIRISYNLRGAEAFCLNDDCDCYKYQEAKTISYPDGKSAYLDLQEAKKLVTILWNTRSPSKQLAQSQKELKQLREYKEHYDAYFSKHVCVPTEEYKIQIEQRTEAQQKLAVAVEALEEMIWMCENVGDFRNGNTCPTGSIDEGCVMARRSIDKAQAALSTITKG